MQQQNKNSCDCISNYINNNTIIFCKHVFEYIIINGEFKIKNGEFKDMNIEDIFEHIINNDEFKDMDIIYYLLKYYKDNKFKKLKLKQKINYLNSLKLELIYKEIHQEKNINKNDKYKVIKPKQKKISNLTLKEIFKK